ncbi:MAG: repressor LexA [Omnitrophica bacterium RIFCSPHIGHO2_02_FULL_63_14]|nr:MAG: repressor LexA [Omnitrophica bacterium RIFCSPHIGHO2_02_FULL_63_14]
MKHKEFTHKQLEAIRHIRNGLVHQGRTPSVRKLMTALGYKSPRSAQDILAQLQGKGVIRKLRSGDYQLTVDPNLGTARAQTVDVPLIGSVACGGPILAEENIQGFIPVSTAIAKPGSKHYLLHARGDSMDKAGIKNGDMVLVRQQSTATQGERVVALIDDEATIKEYRRSNGMVVLMPRSTNQTHKPIILTNDFQVQGLIVAVIPNLK